MNTLVLLSLAIMPASPAAKTFQVVEGPLSYRNLATVENESEFETFTGKTTAVSGSINFDPTAHAGSAKLVVDAKSVDTGIPLRNEHMLSEGWLNVAKYPTITLTTTSVKYKGNDTYTVTGKLTLHGVTKAVTSTAKVKFRAAGDATKAAGFDGDVIQITAKLPIKLSEYGISIPAIAKGKVSNDVTLSVSAYAVAR